MDQESIGMIKEFKKSLKKEFPDAIIYLFGSRARGTHRVGSDFDFIVISKLFQGASMPRRLERVYQHWNGKYNADIIPYTPDELKERSKRLTIAGKAMKESIEL